MSFLWMFRQLEGSPWGAFSPPLFGDPNGAFFSAKRGRGNTALETTAEAERSTDGPQLFCFLGCFRDFSGRYIYIYYTYIHTYIYDTYICVCVYIYTHAFTLFRIWYASMWWAEIQSFTKCSYTWFTPFTICHRKIQGCLILKQGLVRIRPILQRKWRLRNSPSLILKFLQLCATSISSTPDVHTQSKKDNQSVARSSKTPRNTNSVAAETVSTSPPTHHKLKETYTVPVKSKIPPVKWSEIEMATSQPPNTTGVPTPGNYQVSTEPTFTSCVFHWRARQLDGWYIQDFALVSPELLTKRAFVSIVSSRV